jgi:hypothetical protein
VQVTGRVSPALTQLETRVYLTIVYRRARTLAELVDRCRPWGTRREILGVARELRAWGLVRFVVVVRQHTEAD